MIVKYRTNNYPYKVYTALLTQSGGDDFQYGVGFPLIIGRTYTFDNSLSGDNFSNVGGPNITVDNSYDGYSFVATGTTPISWSGGSTLTWNTGAPVVTVLENTIGNVWFTYGSTGQYNLYSNETFSYNKVFCQGYSISEDGANFKVTSVFWSTPNQIVISTTRPIDSLNYDDILSNTPIEIRVYN